MVILYLFSRTKVTSLTRKTIDQLQSSTERYQTKEFPGVTCTLDEFIIRKRQSHLLPDFHEGLSAVGKSKKEKISVTNSRKPSSLEETGKECMEVEHKMEMNLLEDEHNQKLLFT